MSELNNNTHESIPNRFVPYMEITFDENSDVIAQFSDGTVKPVIIVEPGEIVPIDVWKDLIIITKKGPVKDQPTQPKQFYVPAPTESRLHTFVAEAGSEIENTDTRFVNPELEMRRNRIKREKPVPLDKPVKAIDMLLGLEPRVKKPKLKKEGKRPLRDVILNDWLLFPEGDSPLETVKTDVWLAARGIASCVRANRNIVVGVGEIVAENSGKAISVALPVAASLLAVATLGNGTAPSVNAETIDSKLIGVSVEKSDDAVRLTVPGGSEQVEGMQAKIAEIMDVDTEAIAIDGNQITINRANVPDGKIYNAIDSVLPFVKAEDSTTTSSLSAETTTSTSVTAETSIAETTTTTVLDVKEIPEVQSQSEVVDQEAPSTAEMNDQQFIEWLAGQVNPTVEDYEGLHIDESHLGAFDEELPNTQIIPAKFAGHWTANLYEDGIDQFIKSIKSRDGNCCSVMFFMDKDANIFRLVKDSKQMTYHALGANDTTQGVEIEARNLRDYTPEQMKKFVLLAYGFMRNNNIAIERQNFVGHEELDQQTGRDQKHDMPKTLVDALFPKLQALADAITADEEAKKTGQEIDKNTDQTSLPEPGKAVEKMEEVKIYEALGVIMDEVSKGEGNWDSINTGNSGDTKIGSPNYLKILNGRNLTQLTIQEVIDLQRAHKLFAVGRYQMIRGVLENAVNKIGIDRNRLFDESAQNELMIKHFLLGTKRDHLSAYLRGKDETDNGEKVTLENAMYDMACEWASIPDKTKGYRSHYRGNGNASRGAKARYEQVGLMLFAARQAFIENEITKSQGDN